MTESAFDLPNPSATRSRLVEAGCPDPEKALKILTGLAEPPLSRDAFLALLPALLDGLKNTVDPEMALIHLERFAGEVIDRRFLFSLLLSHRRILDLLLTILGSSQYLAEILIQMPQLFEWLLEPGVLRRPKLKADLDQDLRRLVGRVQGIPRQWQVLRRFKRQEILRVGLQDLLGNQDLGGITLELSNLAEVTLQRATEVCEQELRRRHGIPELRQGEGSPRPCPFTVIGMGKLGGGELNFSSDIDVMFVYGGEGETTGVPGAAGGRQGQIANHEYFAKLAELIIRAIGEVTADGYVFRVDVRLRPGGQKGALALSLDAYELYYESFGETWERQALIKARPVAGDEALGRAFLDRMRPFMYRQYLDHAALGEIRRMKERIEQSLRHDEVLRRDVKLGYGGIREIEFIVQAFQLVHGGQNPWLRESNTLRALHRLAGEGLLSYEDYAGLVRAYTFLRTVEHRLQILHHMQIHTLPQDHARLLSLARRLGYHHRISEDPVADLQRDYGAHTHTVRRIYDGLFRDDVTKPTTEANDLVLFFEAGGALERIRPHLAVIPFEEVERALKNFQALRDGPALGHYGPSARRALARLAPALLKALAETPDPDVALNRFERLVAAIGARDAVLTMLAEQPVALALLIRVFGVSEFLSQTLVRHPDLLAILFDAGTVTQMKSRQEMAEELRMTLRAAPPGSPRLDALRRYKKREELRIGVWDILGKADVAQVHAALSCLAEVCLEGAMELATEDLRERYGQPDPTGFVVLGLGKLGGEEMSYNADLDVAFAYQQDGRTIAGEMGRPGRAEYYSKLADRVTKALTTITQEGAVYRVDSRLRPWGSKGPLAQPLEAFAQYFARYAELWERQAYIKARPVAGDADLGRLLMSVLHDEIYHRPLPSDVAQRIDAMRRRIEEKRTGPKGKELHLKLGSGGIVDIEFIVQYLQLTAGPRDPALREPNTLRALDALAGAGVLPADDAKALATSYRFLRRTESRLRIGTEPSLDAIPRDRRRLIKLARRLGYQGNGGSGPDARFLTEYRDHAARVRAIYNRIFVRGK
ncbi:MAG: bifunctional [glutamate--ammonia ligase]-adenylyl-L-tyrosine phosphorylase/[glutamate--ammonia-ligase] adenylyltransferase [Candidatus Methylomirabilales bacterium]